MCYYIRTANPHPGPFTQNESRTSILQDELEKYLQADLAGDDVTDILLWWKEKKNEYPNVSKMAQDFLSCPASSASVEREFSKASDIATSNRSNLLPESIRITHELKSYFFYGGQKFNDFVFSKLLENA